MKDKRLPYIITSIVLVLILACGFFFIHMPLAKQVQDKRLELSNKQSELKLVRQKILELTKLKQEYKSIQEQARILADKIPQDPNEPDIVSLMGKFAIESGITVTKVSFEETPPPPTGEAANQNNVPAGNTNTNSIDIKKCTMTLNGKYDSLIHFFSAIKSSPRLFGIERIVISQDGADGKSLKLDLSLAYFNYKAGVNNQPVTQ